jgi:hypothetical protein
LAISRRAIVLDTGPLLDLLVVRLTENGVAWSRPPQLQAITSPLLASEFLDVLQRAPRRVFTTSAVLAEIHRLVRSADDGFLLTFWSSAVEILSQLQIRDRGHRPLIEWSTALHECLGNHGPTDIGLLALCEGLVEEYDQAIVVTNENSLLAESRRIGLRRVSAADPITLIKEVLGRDAGSG